MRPRAMGEPACVTLLQRWLPNLGLRWPGFRRVRRQVCKRIGRRIRGLGLDGVAAYERRLATDPGEREILDRFCRITISRFFRDVGVWRVLADIVLPALAGAARARGEHELRAWSAGCASGEEPYSLAILWRCGPGRDWPEIGLGVLATDAEERVIERARRGVYARGSLKEIAAVWRDRAFRREDGRFRLKPAYRKGVEFRIEDVRRAVPPGRFDLVLCRNLAFTYFDEATQRRVLAALADRLVAGGALMIGAHERLPATTAFEPWARCIFRRRPTA